MPDATEPFDVYVNGLEIGSGPWDFSIQFFLRKGTDPKESPTALGVIRMSPAHALIMARLLQRQVDVYQANIGKILLPPKLYNELGLEE